MFSLFNTTIRKEHSYYSPIRNIFDSITLDKYDIYLFSYTNPSAKYTASIRVLADYLNAFLREEDHIYKQYAFERVADTPMPSGFLAMFFIRDGIYECVYVKQYGTLKRVYYQRFNLESMIHAFESEMVYFSGMNVRLRRFLFDRYDVDEEFVLVDETGRN